MTSEELAQEVNSAVRSAMSRVTGVGAEQYDDGSGVQKFEKLPIGELGVWALEEIDDLIVYAVMLRIRIARIAKAVQ
jgi:hypothetical protein